MSILNSSRDAHGGPQVQFRSPNRTRLNLTCEALEDRQLLSADSAVTSSTQLTAQPSLTMIPLVSNGPSGYSPQQIQTAYGVNAIKFSSGTVSGDGAGETIAIVDAYNDPTIASDLAKFDSEYGLSAPPSFVVKNLGATTTNAGWALETSLDVEWAHAIAPDADIVLVEAASSNLNSLFSAVSYASNLSGVGVVSMSWGTEEFWGESSYDSLFTTPAGHTPVTYVASSGDSGAWDGPMYPSVSTNVLSVGGTTLTLNSNGTLKSETGWNSSTGGFSGTDMNFWDYEAAPSYQVAAQQSVGLSYGVRTTPDVSFNANPNTGVAVYDSVSYSGESGWFEVGGTSAAAPAWAGLVAIADQGLATGGKGTLSSTQTLTDLYSLPSSDFNDITSGNNGYSATHGYDLVTGLGSPKANLLVAGLLSENGVSTSVVTTKSTSITTTSTASLVTHQYALVSSSTTAATGTLSATTAATATALSSSSVQFVGVLQTTTTADTSNAGSTADSVAQASSVTAATSSTTATTSVGQSIAQPISTLAPVTTDDTETVPVIDVATPITSDEAPAPTTKPASVPKPVPDAAPADAVQPATPPAGTPVPTPAPEPESAEPEISLSIFDAALESVRDGWSPKRARLGSEPRVIVAEQPVASPSVSTPSSGAASAAVAAAASFYWFRLQEKNDRRQTRWIPGRV